MTPPAGTNAAGCCVCGQTAPDGLIRCDAARCRHFMCRRHAMSYEIDDAAGLRMAYFCSRRCYIETVRRALPVSQEVLIALVAVLVLVCLYLLLLNAVI